MKSKQTTKSIAQARNIKQNLVNDFDPDSFITNDDIEEQNMEYLVQYCFARTIMDSEESIYYV